MIQSDYHMHSSFSDDSEATMDSMIQRSIELGLHTICFTDHMDLDFPIEFGGGFIFNTEIYVERLAALREKYADKINILCGVEYGLRPYLKDAFHHLTEVNTFDFIIGSSHLVGKIDPYQPSYWEGITEEQGITKYLEAIYANVKTFDDFDVYGHIDYAVRYAPNRNKNYSYEKYADLIDAIFTTLIQKGKGIEVNTAGYKYGLGHPHPQTDLLKRYKELGGELITIGSDAHKPEHIGYDFVKAEDLLKSLGYSYYTIYQNRKPEFITL
ncbi:histidinol-phosphatase HisJ family protein [Anaerosporobacter faecicola]|uniref:histidinol-phosphatase HisJ family protein n=1 Tax=Anaerosporobacter faecicola TaxID=2718714 RepID=UPI00143C8075|nr:histidinol-phosphatase HisJ family protein [Anaerosporobacter faecicola]